MDPYATHQEALIKTALRVSGNILELGCGDYSTPLLSAIAKYRGDQLFVKASDPQWANRYKDIAEIEIVDWNVWEPSGIWGLVFLDSEQLTGDRIKQLPKLAKICKVVVMHDDDTSMRHPHYNDMISGFTKSTSYTKHIPWTVVLEV